MGARQGRALLAQAGPIGRTLSTVRSCATAALTSREDQKRGLVGLNRCIALSVARYCFAAAAHRARACGDVPPTRRAAYSWSSRSTSAMPWLERAG